MRLGDSYRLQPNLPGWDGPPDPPADRCPRCGDDAHESAYNCRTGVWRETS